MVVRPFRFRQFEVHHDRSSMKVGTDGVLLGAWVRPGTASRLLDVGTGCGLIALILAQRTKAEVVAIELDGPSAEQAAENFVRSPWSNRLQVVQGDFRTYEAAPFDLIVSNPPFFSKSLQAPSLARNRARHDVTLSSVELIVKSVGLLRPKGRLAVVLPMESAADFTSRCREAGLFPARRCDVSTLEGEAPRRVLLEFVREPVETECESLSVGSPGQARTDAYSALTADLYL